MAATDQPLIKIIPDTRGKLYPEVHIHGARLCWAYIDEPESKPRPDGTTRQTWRTQLLLPGNTPGLEDLKAAIQSIRKARGGGRAPVLKDGDAEIARAVEERGANPDDLSYYRGMWIISASSGKRPGVEGTDLYSGSYASAAIRLDWYDQDGNKGVRAWLNHIVKRGEGDRLGGSTAGTPLGVSAIAAPVPDLPVQEMRDYAASLQPRPRGAAVPYDDGLPFG